jgi:hypothetical protein
MQVPGMTTIDDLPDEMIEYLPAEDLSITVPVIKHRWMPALETNRYFSLFEFNRQDSEICS